jgi:hypothetical protein
MEYAPFVDVWSSGWWRIERSCNLGTKSQERAREEPGKSQE